MTVNLYVSCFHSLNKNRYKLVLSTFFTHLTSLFQAKCPGSVPMLPQAGLTRGPSTIVGFVSSPHYPSNYGNNQLCVWKLHVPSGHSVKLTFLDFKIEGSTNCRFDYVEMRNGSTASSPPLGKFCGYRKPPVIIAGSGSMYITFKSDGSVVKKGFRAKYEPTY